MMTVVGSSCMAGLHANRLAADTEVTAGLIPPGPGVTSALGLLVTNLKHEYGTTVMRAADRLDLSAVAAAWTPSPPDFRRLNDALNGEDLLGRCAMSASPNKARAIFVATLQLAPDRWQAYLTGGAVVGGTV